ncbi:MAG: alginate export family protein [Acidobacteriota bacterium]
MTHPANPAGPTWRFLLGVCLAGLLWAGNGRAAESLAQVFQEGTPVLDLRYRYEQVDQDGFSSQAQASTLRLRLGYRTGSWHDFHAAADLEHIRAIGADRFNSTANGRTRFPVVADPEGTEINQAFLAYTGLERSEVRLGRQRIALGNQRFIGNVGWRQNEQTYDAFSIRTRPTEDLSLFYAHMENVNRIFGEDNPNRALADLNVNADIAQAVMAFAPGRLTVYAHFLELEDVPLNSHRNLGLRFSGQHAVADRTDVLYAVEYADQSDYKRGARKIDASYQLLMVGLKYDALTFQLGYEHLGGDGTYGFSTPLATLHAWNGWADVFLTTPLAGLEDTSFSAAGKFAGIHLKGVYHQFDADKGNADYGHEIDLMASVHFLESYDVSLHYARYEADTFFVDIDKFWLTLRAHF